jgi:hypothetical protein
MLLSDASEIWARQQANLALVDVEGRAAAVLREDLDELAQAGFERPLVRLLPYFDSFLLGHRQREHLMALEHQPKVYRAQGWIAPMFLVDGRAAGVWEYARDGNRLLITVKPFGSVSDPETNGIREEAQDLGRFLELPNVEVQIG